MSLQTFAPSGYTSLEASAASTNVALPSGSSPTAVLVTNLSGYLAYILLGDSEVSVSSSTGTPLLPGDSIGLTIGSNTNIAAVGNGPISVVVGI
jgi:hypothetical protein